MKRLIFKIVVFMALLFMGFYSISCRDSQFFGGERSSRPQAPANPNPSYFTDEYGEIDSLEQWDGVTDRSSLRYRVQSL